MQAYICQIVCVTNRAVRFYPNRTQPPNSYLFRELNIVEAALPVGTNLLPFDISLIYLGLLQVIGYLDVDFICASFVKRAGVALHLADGEYAISRSLEI